MPARRRHPGALTQRWPWFAVLVALCVGLRQWDTLRAQPREDDATVIAVRIPPPH